MSLPEELDNDIEAQLSIPQQRPASIFEVHLAPKWSGLGLSPGLVASDGGAGHQRSCPPLSSGRSAAVRCRAGPYWNGGIGSGV